VTGVQTCALPISHKTIPALLATSSIKAKEEKSPSIGEKTSIP